MPPPPPTAVDPSPGLRPPPGRVAGARAGALARGTAALVVLLATGACADTPRTVRAAPPDSTVKTDELVRLHEERDYFALRERLGAPGLDEPAGVTVLRAATASAFNEPERSEALLAAALAAGDALPDSLLYEARRIRAGNLLRLHRWDEAADVYAALLEGAPPHADPREVADDRKMLRFTRALEDVPPQRVTSRSATTLPGAGHGRIRVTVGDSVRRYVLDASSDVSAVARSEARDLGLEIREADLPISTALFPELTADLAVADRVRLGGIELRDVVVLVLPDEVLTFPLLRVRGIVGFPVLEALGQVRFRPDGGIEVPGEVPEREVRNLAIHDLSAYVRVGYRGDHLLCALDRGSRETWFLEPFYRRYRSRVEAEGTPDTVPSMPSAATGGRWALPTYRLADVPLRVGDRTVTLPRVQVSTKPVWRSGGVECVVGRDLLTGRGAYTLNFRSMSLLLE